MPKIEATIPRNWKARRIPGFPGYIVCFKGNVYSCRGTGSGRWSKKWKRLKACHIVSRKYKYAGVCLYKDNGIRKLSSVGRLVLLAFKGTPPRGFECCHKNGDATDNRLSNLYWGSRKDNIRDAISHGTHNCIRRGDTEPFAKLTEEQVREIRRDYIPWKRPLSYFARKFHVSVDCIHDVILRRTWEQVV